MMAMFLAGLDQTMQCRSVTTALPTIVAQLGGGKDYAWVGSAYLLASASLNPLYGKLADVMGRKFVFYPAMCLFLLGSALCGAAQTMDWLIVSRAIQGAGFGGIVQMVQIIIADIFSLEDRGKYGGYIGAAFGIATIAGPLIGGALTDHISWRWCFWVNLPTGGAATILLFFFLNLNPHQGKTFREHVRQFDFVGLLLLVIGITCVLLGFNESGTAWNSPATISLLVVGFVVLVIGGIYEVWTKRSPIIPHGFLSFSYVAGDVVHHIYIYIPYVQTAAFYLPLYFQVLRASATRAGIQMLSFALAISFTSTGAGHVVARIGDYRPVIWFSWCVSCLGYGLMIMLDDTSSLAEQVIYPLIAGIGIGGLFQPPLVGVQAAMPVKDMATATVTMGLIKTLGATIGVSVGQAIWTSELRRRTVSIPNFGLSIQSGALVDSVRQIQHIQPESLRQEVLHAYSKSISTIWIVATPLCGVGFIMVLFLKKYTLKREVIHSGKNGTRGTQMPDAGLVTPTDPLSSVEKGMHNDASTTTNDTLSAVNQDGE
ncbi:major facilitator superfamily domain-containing protein [Gautieria morchelliformis]|nr:major facilitator superfamily domain-containing protein [Gautieria morchelliformis]